MPTTCSSPTRFNASLRRCTSIPPPAGPTGIARYVGGRAAGVWKAHPHLTEALVRAGEVVPQPGSLVWRSSLDAVGPLDESFEFTMDADLFLRLIDGGYPPVYVPAVLARFEVHAGSKTGGDTRAAFLEEHARALAKSGRANGAAVMYGRAAVAVAARASRIDEELSSRRRLTLHLARPRPGLSRRVSGRRGLRTRDRRVQDGAGERAPATSGT